MYKVKFGNYLDFAIQLDSLGLYTGVICEGFDKGFISYLGLTNGKPFVIPFFKDVRDFHFKNVRNIRNKK